MPVKFTEEFTRDAVALGKSGIAQKTVCADLPRDFEVRTVPGRTYADADALDVQAYSAAFDSGGRYAGDSWTTV